MYYADMDSVLRSSEEIEVEARNLANRLKPSEHAPVIALYGELGAGKTTFVQYLVKALGGSDRVVSPTFILLRVYPLSHPHFSQVVHVDAYRLTDAEEARTLALHEYLQDPKNIVCIEWAEKVKEILPDDAIEISLSHHPEGRTISYDNY